MPFALRQQDSIESFDSREHLGALVGGSPSMHQVYRQIQIASRHNFPVLILGESGTGKELAARSIHDLTLCRPRPFVPVDCAALVPTLIESELFGYVKGAFTGADHSRIGLLQAACGGTLFLDEVGELPLYCQAKLLRALQEREVRPVGATERIRIDVRVIAATNRKLESEVKAGHFRQDLYFRLNVLQIQLPPLREHKDDIPLLIDFFFKRFRHLQPQADAFSEAARVQLMAYDWPGNVRELENAVEHGMVMSSGPIIGAADLPASVRLIPSEDERIRGPILSLREMEKRAIHQALDETSGDRMAAARLLQIGKTTLYRKLKEYRANATGP